MHNDKILVEIAAYCDPELLNTINSALIQADNPDRVYFSVCYQSDDEEDYKKLKEIKNCKVKWLKQSEARGSCYARYLCQQMIDDEEYVYQIDSHMRFVKHWDTKLIEELLSLNDPKAIISFYPADCNGEMMFYPLDDKAFDNPTTGGIMYVTGFREESLPFVSTCCELVDTDEKSHLRSVLISAGNFFAFSGAHKEALHDPEMYFYGDELCMSIKLFTHGWNVYNSKQAYIYHQYCRADRKFPSVNNAMNVEKNKLVELIQNKNNKEYLLKENYGLERTIDEFEKYSGIDFENELLYLTATTGELNNKKYIGKVSYFSQREFDKKKTLNNNEKIEVLIVDLFGNYKKCVESCLESALYKDRVNIIVGSITNKKPTKEECSKMQIKKFISFGKNSHYSKILNKIAKELDDDYVCVVDSSVRFMQNWDKYNLDTLKNCGNKSVLTHWLFKADEKDKATFQSYINIEKRIIEFQSYLPLISYDDQVDLTHITCPYETGTIFDGLIFCNSNILKEIEIDPNLRYDEQKVLYSLRLWTNGINIYIPNESHFLRVEEEDELNTIPENYSTVAALCGIKDGYSKTFAAGYKYDIGYERPLWGWYKHINIKYDNKKGEIVKE